LPASFWSNDGQFSVLMHTLRELMHHSFHAAYQGRQVTGDQ
jgi:hypothetical protein